MALQKSQPRYPWRQLGMKRRSGGPSKAVEIAAASRRAQPSSKGSR